MNTKAKRGLIAFACLLVLSAGATFGAGEYISRPRPAAVGEPAPDLFASDVLLPNGKGFVSGWVARGAGSGAVLLLHGVRADRRAMQARALFLNRLGYTVLLIDLPAHGQSYGDRITFGAREAAGVRIALAWLRRNLPGEKIGVIGSSLGAAALVLSRPGGSVDAVVLEAMYPTIEEATASRLEAYLGAPGAWLTPLLVHQLPLRAGVAPGELRPIDAVPELQAPVLVIGGAEDSYTSAAATRRLFAAAPQPKQLWLVEGAGHVDFHAFGTKPYEATVGAFLHAHLRAREGQLRR